MKELIFFFMFQIQVSCHPELGHDAELKTYISQVRSFDL
jgi:hypothetical protein